MSRGLNLLAVFISTILFACGVLMMGSSHPKAQTISRVNALKAGPLTLSATDTGTCATANACVVLQVNGYAALGIQATGTCGTCTLNFETTMDDVNWVATNLVPVGASTAVSSASASGAWTSGALGPIVVSQARARMSALVSGSFSVIVRATISAPLPLITSAR
jgi:hypothetical protein